MSESCGFILGSRWLGHGRFVEALLSFICLTYGLTLLLVPSAPWDSRVTVDLAWQGWGQAIAGPFLLKAALSGTGLVANILGSSTSRYLRLSGALVGSFIWTWLLVKFTLVGAPFSFGAICALAFLVSSVRIVGMSLADLPLPGSPGTA